MDSIRSRRTWAIEAKYARSDARVPLSVVNLPCFILSSGTRRKAPPAQMLAWAGFGPRPLATVVIKNTPLKSRCCDELDCPGAAPPIVTSARAGDRITIQRRPHPRHPPWKIFHSSEHGVALEPTAGVRRGGGHASLPWTFFDRIVKWSTQRARSTSVAGVGTTARPDVAGPFAPLSNGVR